MNWSQIAVELVLANKSSNRLIASSLWRSSAFCKSAMRRLTKLSIVALLFLYLTKSTILLLLFCHDFFSISTCKIGTDGT
jgi:hypothetical protein